MKKILLIVALLIISTTVIFAAQPTKGVGVGLTTGIPIHIGPLVEYNFGPATVSLNLGYRYETGGFAAMGGGGVSSFTLGVGGEYNFPKPFTNSGWGADIYLSTGAKLDFSFARGLTLIGIGLPVGWSWYAEKLPIKVFVKAGPELGILVIKNFGNATDFRLAGSIGALYYFDI